ncbi:hypothetical protein Tco_1144808 [Tanacetum coccineum]
MLIIMPFDYLKLCDSNDSAFGVDITSRFPVSSKSIEFLSLCLHTEVVYCGLRHHHLDTQDHEDIADLHACSNLIDQWLPCRLIQRNIQVLPDFFRFLHDLFIDRARRGGISSLNRTNSAIFLPSWAKKLAKLKRIHCAYGHRLDERVGGEGRVVVDNRGGSAIVVTGTSISEVDSVLRLNIESIPVI